MACTHMALLLPVVSCSATLCSSSTSERAVAPVIACRSRFSKSQQSSWFRGAQKKQCLQPCGNPYVLSNSRCSVFVDGQHTVANVEDTKSYKFRDEGKEAELRVRFPKGMEGLTASNVIVDIQEKSVIVAVQPGDGVKVLLAATCLYGLIKPSETMWFVDEDTVVISLKKEDTEIKWPGLEEDWGTLTVGVAGLLKGTSVNIVGENTEINWAVAREIATGLGYVPLQTQDLVQQVTGKTPSELVAEDGKSALAEVEAQILASLFTNVRCVVATVGGQEGAAADPLRWNHLHTGFTVWLKQSAAQDQASAELEAVRERTEGAKAYSKADVVVALSGWDSSSVRPVAEGSLRALKYLIEAAKDLPSKKSLYVRLGARGDWPLVMPAEWNPADN